MTRRPAFQEQAVSRIVARLTARAGARRFLLADEVGLGKTHVAQGVIQALAAKQRRPLVVFYISSSKEIAHQNRLKLVPEDTGEHLEDRLTLLATSVKAIKSGGAKMPRILTLTPGTSLFLTRSTGVQEERRLLLYLIGRLKPRLFTSRCREAFRRGVKPGPDWRTVTTRRSLRKKYDRAVDSGVLRALRREWRIPLKELETWLKGSRREGGSRVIGALRRGLACAVAKALQPGLIVLDEFQRFRDVIQAPDENADHESHILADWFFPVDGSSEKKSSDPSRGTCPPLLLLSATPYRLYTTSHEEASGHSHHEQLFDVLRFVDGTLGRDSGLRRLASDLKAFTQGLPTVLGNGDAEALLLLKYSIEERLKRLMCRTERNWYYVDERKGVIDVPGDELDGGLPSDDEALELHGLLDLLVSSASEGAPRVIDYWKSSPSCLSFMSKEYQARRRIQSAGLSVRKKERSLLVRRDQLSSLSHRNLKVRTLAERVFGDTQASGKLGGASDWPYLWCAPTYRYWSDGIFGQGKAERAEPSKFLVFSHWRFVPGAVAALISDRLERGVDCADDKRWTEGEPLRFRKDLSVGLFDVCFPSIALASMVDPLEIASGLHRSTRGRKPVALSDVRDAASRGLRKRLAECRVLVKESGRGEALFGTRDSLWRVIARLDALCSVDVESEGARGTGSWLSAVIRRHKVRGGQQGNTPESGNARRTLKLYADWLDEGRRNREETVSITPHQFERVLEMSLSSPAVSILRAIKRAIPGSGTHVEDWYAHVLDAGLVGVRHYFNRPYSRAVVDRAVKKRRGYAERVLDYCGSAQLQAVLDEYAFLLAEAAGGNDPTKRAKAAVTSLTNVLTMGVGRPTVRVVDGGRVSNTAVRSHFALAFAEESSDQGGGKTRRRHTREAFNSPFWPFVLATTSVGQEGLDFHWYCRDVVHWNLPSNPVDLEQREGRINRRDGLVVRRSVAPDFPLRSVRVKPEETLWTAVFRTLEEAMSGQHHARHGLFPRWLYETRKRNVPPERIRRHLLHYAGSRDRKRYERLRQDLALYRHVFGQANQEELMARLRQQTGASVEVKRLEPYMLNLAPFTRGYAWNAALAEARRHVHAGDGKWLAALVSHARRLTAQHASALGDEAGLSAIRICDYLAGRASSSRRGTGSGPNVALEAAAALVYLRNPFDDRFDIHRTVGFHDDADKLIKIARRLPKSAPVSEESA